MAELAEKIARYREIQSKNPQSRVYVPLADLLLKNGDFEEALVLLEDGLSRNPDHLAAMVVLGQTLLQSGRVPHGIKVLQRVLDLAPDNFVVLRILAENFLRQDAFAHALPLLERLVEIEPDQPEWPKLLSEARQKMNRESSLATQPEVSSKAKVEGSAGGEGPVGGEGLATMTLVDIMVAQGYLDKALLALQLMHENDPGRQDVSDRIEDIKAGMARPPGTPSVSAKAPAMDPLTRETRVKLRETQKKQFGDWIEQLKTDEDQAL